jgi:hypothetical protein
MTHIRNERTRRQHRRASTTLVLAAASGGLLAAAMAGSPTARADDPFTDIANDVQASVALGESDYTAAGTDFSSAADTNAGLIAAFAGFDNIFISPGDYTLLGLTAAATGTDFSGYGGDFAISDATDPSNITAAGQEAIASADTSDAQTLFSDASSFLTGGEYFSALDYALVGGYDDLLAGQADTLAGLFSLGF